MHNHPTPKFSVITVTYNAEAVLEDTIQSVISQTYRHVEYIIVDGASKDKTLSIIDRYKDHIAKVTSEPDKGLYDAMNKGIRLATGDYLCFLNAGDSFHEDDTLQQMVHTLPGSELPDVMYGETALVDKEGHFVRMRRLSAPETLTWKSFNPAQDGRDKDGNINREVAGVKQLSSIEDEYKGVRQGTGVADNRYSTHSQTTVTTASKIIVMSAAEVWFLRAEAALRYNTGDDVENCYKQGVTVSFAQWDANGVSDYLESDDRPAAYIDVFDAKFNADAPSTITPKWDNTADKEEKLERIITQKWLALYPEGCEAWAEQRRTGYPRLIKVAVNNSGNTISTDDMIRRVFFNQDYKTDNKALYDALVSKLGGADNGGTRLWWDTGRNNF